MEGFISKRMKYRKKPVIIEAIQFEDNPYLKIETLEGIMKASVGDYIIASQIYLRKLMKE